MSEIKPFKNWEDFLNRNISEEDKITKLRQSPKLFR